MRGARTEKRAGWRRELGLYGLIVVGAALIAGPLEAPPELDSAQGRAPVVSGYTVSGLSYDTGFRDGEFHIVAVRFSLDPYGAKAASVEIGGQRVDCRVRGRKAVCPVSVPVADVEDIAVSASG